MTDDNKTTPSHAPGLDLDAVERDERAMTPGPWHVHVLPSSPASGLLVFDVGPSDDHPIATTSGTDTESIDEAEANAHGLVALRNAAPALIAEVRALRAMVERHGEHLRAGADAVRSANASTAEIGARMEAAGEEIEALRAKLAEATSLLRSAGDLFVEIQATDGEDEHKAITDGAKLSAAIAAALEAL